VDLDVKCREIREACSAALDGEPTEISRSAIDRHLRRCPHCRDFAIAAEHLTVTSLREDMPDLAPRVVAAARANGAVMPLWLSPVRVALVLVALAQLGLAVPALLWGTDEGAPIHIAHEAGVWDLALAVGFLFAAWRPLRAVGMLPFVATLSAGLMLTAVIDLVNGHAVALTETTHLLELAGAALLWILVAPRYQRRLHVV
jgi:predicted anti-sigma-YlaC factor YlaD